MKMENTREVSRKEFLEFVPKFVIQNVRSLIQGRLNFSNDGWATKIPPFALLKKRGGGTEGIPPLKKGGSGGFVRARLPTLSGRAGEAPILSDHKAAKVAWLDEERCLAWEGGSCQFCYLACPLRDKAINLDDQKPFVNILFCD